MINFNEEKMIFSLSTKNTSYIFGFLKGKFLTHLYWGKLLTIENPVYELFLEVNKYCRNMCAKDYNEYDISRDCLPSEYSTFGNTDQRTPAFHAVYKNGSFITELEYESHNIYNGKNSINGLPYVYVENDNEAQSLEIVLVDKLTCLKVVLCYSVFEELDAITRSVRIINGGNDDIKLDSVLSAVVDFKEAQYDFIHLPGAWTRERHPERVPLMTGKQIVDSARGNSSAQHNPFFALVGKNTDENNGDAYGFNLVYSGNFTAGVEVDPYNTARAFIGINPFAFSWKLEAGQEFASPEAVLVYSDKGIGGMSRIYHKLYRTRLCRSKFRDTERYVLINNWEATYMKFDEEKILKIAKKAKEVGVELLVLDDGWFGKRNKDNCSLGDWYVNTEKLPNGLKGLADKLNAMGLKFGLWFEPEMVSPDSDLYRAHPDWCIHSQNRIRSVARNQLVLDLSRQDVCNYIYKCLFDNLSTVNIEYVKWDYNRTMSNIGSALLEADRQGEFFHRYILGLYGILERLNNEFPDVLFESCSSGGARFDPGMLYYMPQTWASDCTDALERVYIQYGTSMCYPYSCMGAHVSIVPNHQVGRTTPLSARSNVAMQGQYGFELDLNKLSDDEIESIKNNIKEYKKLGEVFHKGDLYRLVTPENRYFVSNEFLSEDKTRVVVVNFVMRAVPNSPVYYLKLQGLDREAMYSIEGTNSVLSGAVLMSCGLPYQLDNDYNTRTIILNRL
ncbi:MAG: alpha-galactosidase [Acutalibacteraceae bacterium]|nr:alpha-galactosidase [Acutalibacteraceae bacterium]